MHPNKLAPAAIVVPAAQQAAAQASVDTRAIQVFDAAHYLHPFTDSKALAGKGARVMVKG